MKKTHTFKFPVRKTGVVISALLALSVFMGHAAWALDIRPMPPLTKKDRILIFAPHPDDETIGTGGVIQQAVSMHIPVRVVYLTNGDNNELSFLVYKKHPVLTRRGLLAMGEMRRKEAENAMAFLGLKPSQLTFLGYPDFGTMRIFTQYWGKENKPYRSMLLHVSSVPYENSMSPRAPFRGENILRNMEEVILQFRPTRIFVSHPADVNSDHRACYLFVRVALWDLAGQIPEPQIYPCLVHFAHWPAPRGYHPKKNLLPPKKLQDTGIQWETLALTPAEVKKKREAIAKYRSQIEYIPWYLPSFARANELFGVLPDIVLPESQGKAIDWSTLGKQETVTGHIADDENFGKQFIHSVVYTRVGDDLYVRIVAARWTSRLLGIYVYLFGYSPDTPFAYMPKLKILITGGHHVRIFEKERPAFVEGVTLHRHGTAFILKVPLDVLGSPDRILTVTRARFVDVPVEATAWQVLEVPQGNINDQ